MLNAYQLPTMQIRVTHGPGRRPASGQLFLGFEGPGPVMFGYVAEGERIGAAGRLARQFAHSRTSYCSWGSHNIVPEYCGGP
jgi:2,3-dihydroxy-p-cumate/2,3-dihydroxybenzoate 3,4-dioxygenase